MNSNVAQAFVDAGFEKLEGKGRQGDFVHAGQVMGTADGFKNVSKIWLDQTLTYDQMFDRLDSDKAKSHDITCTVKDMLPTVMNGKFGFLYRPKEEFYVPTEHALNQLAIKTDIGTWYANSLRENPLKPGKEGDEASDYKYTRDAQDAETLVHVVKNGLRRLDQAKKFFFRLRDDGTMRAFLTERFAVIDNRWVMEQMRKIIPGGRFSHWKGDADNIYGNVLVPDSIREEKDSDYGGMLSLGNSEIGMRRLSAVPSVFRAICMNGCIWDQEKGKEIAKVHRGKINLEMLALQMKEGLNAQIPLVAVGIERFLKTRQYAWDGAEVSIKPVIAQLALDQKFDKKKASAVLKAWAVEKDNEGYSLFGLMNAVTRAGQTFDDNNTWVQFDEVGGQLMLGGENILNRLVTKAKSLTTDEVDEVFTGKGKKNKELALAV